MSIENIDRMQIREIERDERWLRQFDSPSPSGATVLQVKLRVKEATRFVANEDWLAECVSPTPSDALKAKVRQAIRAELGEALAGGLKVGGRGVWSPQTYRIFGALSAAAMLIMSVSVARLAPGPKQEVVEAELFVVSDLFSESDDEIAEIWTELSAIESGTKPVSDWGESTREESLDTIDDDLDSLISDIQGGQETS